MATSYNTTDFGGILKRVYGNEIVDLVPDNLLFVKEISFKSTTKIGEKYFESVTLAYDQGFTYAAPNSGPFTYADAIAGVNKQAQVDAYTIAGQTLIDYQLAARAIGGGSQQAFKSALDLPITNFMTSMRNRQELNTIYGGSSIGTISANSSGTLTITDATWAAGIWTMLIGAKLTIFQGATTTPRVSNVSITGMDLAQRKITVSDATGVVANDTIWIAGVRGNEALGIKSILTTSGTLFGIDNTAYNLFSGNTYHVGGALTHAKIEDAAALASDKGFSGDRMLVVNPRVWSDLMVEQSVLRRFTGNETKLKNGARAVEFGSAVGTITAIPCPTVMQGDGFLLDMSSFSRIGTTDVQLGPPGGKDDAIVRLTDKNAYQVISFSDQATFCRKPGNNVYLSGITI